MIKLVKVRVSVQRIKMQMVEVYFLVDTNEPEIGDEYVTVENNKCKLLWTYQKHDDGGKIKNHMVKKRRGINYI